MTAAMSWQHSPVSSTTPSGWGSGCRSETGRSLSWSTMTSSTSRRMARRSGWRKGRSSSSSREQTTTGGRYVLKKHKCLNALKQTFYWSRIKSGLAWCQVFKRQFLMRGPWFTSALSRVFSNLERAPSREEQLNWYFHFPRASKNLMTWTVSSCVALVTGHVTLYSHQLHVIRTPWPCDTN